MVRGESVLLFSWAPPVEKKQQNIRTVESANLSMKLLEQTVVRDKIWRSNGLQLTATRAILRVLVMDLVGDPMGRDRQLLPEAEVAAGS